MKLRKITQLGLLVAMCTALRIVFQWLPNIQPISAFFLILVSFLGLSSALAVAIITMVVTGFYMGFGYWVAFQCLAYAIVLFLMKYLINKPLLIRAAYAFLSGLLYGFIISLCYNLFFGLGHFGVYYLAGIPFDLWHALSNLCFYLLLYPLLRKALKQSGAAIRCQK
ncbi:MAG: ECF transporter S component [Streptococcaceae bacterium]|jgi:hypothetical protein|nr:ECF transporter S component [Streptococcaceae bacterium]